MKAVVAVTLLVFIVAFKVFAIGNEVPGPGMAQGGLNRPDTVTKEIGFDQHPGDKLPLNLQFNDEHGAKVPLGQYFSGGMPVVLGMMYYGCPNICTLVLDGLFKALLELPIDAGKKYQVVLVSIDPSETSDLALEKKSNYLAKRYKKAGGEDGIHFLTGDESSIQQLAQAVGFRYKYDEKNDQYAHPAGLMVVTPEGVLSKYFYGIEYAWRDLRLGLVEASQNKIGSVIDKFLLLCYHYDPSLGTYTRSVLGIVRWGGILTLFCVLSGVSYMLLQEKKKFREQKVLRAS